MLIIAPTIVSEEGILVDHAIWVEKGCIQKIAPRHDFPKKCKSLALPNTILIPGLMNCHCHLELSQLPEPLPYPGSFVGWIEQLTHLKMQMSPEDLKQAIRIGIQKLMEGGTTTVADHGSCHIDSSVLFASPLDGVLYMEVLGVEEKRALQFMNEALELQDQKDPNGKFEVIPTPHAPYSLLPEVFSELLRLKSARFPFSIHIAESAEEFRLFKDQAGPLFDFLRMKGKTPPTVGETPVRFLRRLGLLPRGGMAIHANYLTDEDIPLIKEAQMSVVHCPGSHAYFGHERFPLGLLEEAGVNVALGTDSLASNASLSMFEQMRLALDSYAELNPKRVLAMATFNGAKALGQHAETGSIQEGKWANIVGVPHRFPKRDIYENVVFSETPGFMMIRGKSLL